MSGGPESHEAFELTSSVRGISPETFPPGMRRLCPEVGGGNPQR